MVWFLLADLFFGKTITDEGSPNCPLLGADRIANVVRIRLSGHRCRSRQYRQSYGLCVRLIPVM